MRFAGGTGVQRAPVGGMNYTAPQSFRAPTVQEGPGSFMSGQRGAMEQYQRQLATLMGHVDIPGVNQTAPGVFVSAPDPRQPFANMPQMPMRTPSGPVDVANPFGVKDEEDSKENRLQTILRQLMGLK